MMCFKRYSQSGWGCSSVVMACMRPCVQFTEPQKRKEHFSPSVHAHTQRVQFLKEKGGVGAHMGGGGEQSEGG